MAMPRAQQMVTMLGTMWEIELVKKSGNPWVTELAR